MRLGSAALIGATLGLSAVGCVSRPKLLDPGTVPEQRHEALQFDPYPDNSLGPTVLGGRPREYDRPRPPPKPPPPGSLVGNVAPQVGSPPAPGVVGGFAPTGLAPNAAPYSPGPIT